jgi:2,3-bisphosphoglycerate-independent phosphoglycerate mutase
VVTPRLLVLVADGAGALLAAVDLPAIAGLPYTERVVTIPSGMPVASEVALPGLLGRRVAGAPARGAVEAAGLGVPVGPGEAAWRLDIGGCSGPPEALASFVGGLLEARVDHLRRGRFLVIGPRAWLRDGGQERRRRTIEDAVGQPVRWWGGGPAVDWTPLAWTTAVVAAPTGAAAGTSRLLRADLVVPAGATGFPGTDLAAKSDAATRLLDVGRHELVTVHVGAVDEAGHSGDAPLQRDCLEEFDRLLVAPLLEAAAERGIDVLVASDHGTDPATGRHVGGPVPASATFPLPTRCSSWDLVSGVVTREVAA